MKRALAFAQANSWVGANIGLMSLGLAVLAILELQAAIYAMKVATTTDLWNTPFGLLPSAGILSAGKSVGFSLLGFFGMAVATQLACHERPASRAQAGIARLVAIGCMTIPVGNLASYLAFERQQKEWAVYVVSPAYEADKALATDWDADSRARLEATQKITPPAIGHRDFADWFAAIFWHGLVMFAAGVRLAGPVSREERETLKARERSERAKKAAKKRKQTRRKAVPFAKPKLVKA
jgi:hypothetical protein